LLINVLSRQADTASAVGRPRSSGSTRTLSLSVVRMNMGVRRAAPSSAARRSYLRSRPGAWQQCIDAGADADAQSAERLSMLQR